MRRPSGRRWRPGADPGGAGGMARQLAVALVVVGSVVGVGYLWWTAPDRAWACGDSSGIACERVAGGDPVTDGQAPAGEPVVVATAPGGWTATLRGDEVILAGGVAVRLPPAPGARVETMAFSANGKTLLVARSRSRGTWRNGRLRNRPGGDLTVVDNCWGVAYTTGIRTPLVALAAAEGRDTFTARLADGALIRLRLLPGPPGLTVGECRTGWPRPAV